MTNEDLRFPRFEKIPKNKITGGALQELEKMCKKLDGHWLCEKEKYKEETQIDKVFNFLRRNKKITSSQAQKIGINCLRKQIEYLKKKGIKIQIKRFSKVSSAGDRVQYCLLS